MIKVEVSGIVSVSYVNLNQGHAGYGRSGKDIVCAAVSALAYTAAGALEELAGIKGTTKGTDI